MIDPLDLVKEQNTDAQKWAKAFMDTKEKNNFVIDEALMIGWFANAIMTMNDKLKNEEKDLISSMNDVMKVQGSDGNWNSDPYMHGMFNGMEMIFSMAERRSPEFKDAPKKWLSEISTEKAAEPVGLNQL